MKDPRQMLSTLWIFAVLNYLYCDVVGFMDASLLRQYLAGTAGGMSLTQGFLLGGSVLMEISIAMVLLSRVLKYRANRLANIIAGAIAAAAQIATLLAGTPTAYYAFFSAVEIACTAFIVVSALRWKLATVPASVPATAQAAAR